MSNDMKPWLILPCSGIGKTLGTISRWAAYNLVEDQKLHGIRLLCLARLVDTDSEALTILQSHRIITIDGCPKKCATVNVEKNHIKVEKTYLMARFMAKNKNIVLEKNVIDPGPGGLELARKIADEIEIDILNGGQL